MTSRARSFVEPIETRLARLSKTLQRPGSRTPPPNSITGSARSSRQRTAESRSPLFELPESATHLVHDRLRRALQERGVLELRREVRDFAVQLREGARDLLPVPRRRGGRKREPDGDAGDDVARLALGSRTEAEVGEPREVAQETFELPDLPRLVPGSRLHREHNRLRRRHAAFAAEVPHAGHEGAHPLDCSLGRGSRKAGSPEGYGDTINVPGRRVSFSQISSV